VGWTRWIAFGRSGASRDDARVSQVKALHSSHFLHCHRCRATSEHIRQSNPEFGPGFQVKVPQTLFRCPLFVRQRLGLSVGVAEKTQVLRETLMLCNAQRPRCLGHSSVARGGGAHNLTERARLGLKNKSTRAQSPEGWYCRRPL